MADHAARAATATNTTTTTVFLNNCDAYQPPVGVHAMLVFDLPSGGQEAPARWWAAEAAPRLEAAFWSLLAEDYPVLLGTLRFDLPHPTTADAAAAEGKGGGGGGGCCFGVTGVPRTAEVARRAAATLREEGSAADPSRAAGLHIGVIEDWAPTPADADNGNIATWPVSKLHAPFVDGESPNMVAGRATLCFDGEAPAAPAAAVVISVMLHHTIGDAASIALFLGHWAERSRNGNRALAVPPVHDRSLFSVVDTLGTDAAATAAPPPAFCRACIPMPPCPDAEIIVAGARDAGAEGYRLRFYADELAALQARLREETGIAELSKNDIVAASMWVCQERGALACGGDRDGSSVLLIPVNARGGRYVGADGRQVPPTYFGNGVTGATCETASAAATAAMTLAEAAAVVHHGVRRLAKSSDAFREVFAWEAQRGVDGTRARGLVLPDVTCSNVTSWLHYGLETTDFGFGDVPRLATALMLPAPFPKLNFAVPCGREAARPGFDIACHLQPNVAAVAFADADFCGHVIGSSFRW